MKSQPQDQHRLTKSRKRGGRKRYQAPPPDDVVRDLDAIKAHAAALHEAWCRWLANDQDVFSDDMLEPMAEILIICGHPPVAPPRNERQFLLEVDE